MQILNKVDINDLIEINISRPTLDTISITLDAIEPGMKVVIDSKALETLNNKLTSKAKGLQPSDPKTIMYLEEFCAKMLTELHKHDLVILEEASDSPEDHYKKWRDEYGR